MVTPESYLAACGWELRSVGSGSNKRHELIRHEGAEEDLQQLRKTTPSLNGFDLLLRCLASGYNIHNAQQVLCHVLERQDHLTTKAFVIEENRPSQLSAIKAAAKIPSSNIMAGGDFFSWTVEKPSLRRDPMLGGGDSQGNEHNHGGNVMHFDDAHTVPHTVPLEGTVNSPQEMVFRLDMPLDAYKYPSEVANSLHGGEMILQMDGIPDQRATGVGLRDPFVVSSDFEEAAAYMDAAMSFDNRHHGF